LEKKEERQRVDILQREFHLDEVIWNLILDIVKNDILFRIQNQSATSQAGQKVGHGWRTLENEEAPSTLTANANLVRQNF